MSIDSDILIIKEEVERLVTVEDTQVVVVPETVSSVVSTTDTEVLVVTDEQQILLVSVGEQGPQGIPGSNTDHDFSIHNIDSVSLPPGTPVEHVLNNDVVRATSSSGNKCFALVGDTSIAAGGFGLARDIGVLNLTTDEWDAVTDQSGGLISGSTYYLATASGKLTTTPNLSSGALVVVGFASSKTDLRLSLGNQIQL